MTTPMKSTGPLEPILPTDRTTHRRLKDLGSHDRELIYRILDEGLVCHVGFPGPRGTFVLPMGYARDGDSLLLHGSVGSRLMLFSDGLVEQPSLTGALFGLEAVVKTLTDREDGACEIDCLLAALENHAGGSSFDDDVTMAAITRV